MRIANKDVPAGLTGEERKLWIRAANKALAAGKTREEAIAAANARDKEDDKEAEAGEEAADAAATTDAGEAAEETDEEKKKKDAAARSATPRTPDAIFHRSFSLTSVPKSYDEEARQCEAVISVGKRVRRRDGWFGDEFDEVLDMRPGSIRLERLNGGAQLLDGHNYYSGLGGILGAVVPGSARIDGEELKCRFQFSRSELGERVAQDLSDGLPLLLSTGYKTYKEIIDSTTSPETRTAVDWEPLEVSIVPVSAEGAATGFRSHPTQGGVDMKTEAQIRAEIEAEIAAKAAADAEAKRLADEALKRAAEEARKVAEAERARVTEILTANRAAELPAAFAEEAIKRGDTIADFRTLVIAELAKKAKERGINGAHQQDGDPLGGTYDPVTMRVSRDASEGESEAMVEALSIRMLSARRDVPGITTEAQREWCERQGRVDMVALSRRIYDGHEKPQNERTREFFKFSVVEIAARCIGWKRQILPGNVTEILSRAYSVRSFHSTGDFPAIFENALNKTLLARYQLALPTYREIAIERTFVDFRPHSQVRTGEFPTLEEVPETGEIKAGTAIDSKESVSLKAYGRQYGISRQAMINDDIGGMEQILASIGDVALIFENTKFFAMLNSNPVLVTDSTAVFNAAHGNLNSPGSNPGVTTISLGRKAMRKQTSISGNFINVAPRIILTGPNQETKADQVVATITPNVLGSVNPFSGKLRSVSDANITGDEWYLFCEPGQVPVFVYGFLSGASGPRMRTEEPFGYQGVRFSVEHDFGVGAIDFRGAYKDEGTGTSGLP